MGESDSAGEGLQALGVPAGCTLVRSTPEFTAETVPAALLSAHRVASGIWGRLVVEAGTVLYVLERSGGSRRLGAGEHQVIEPDVPHHVEPGEGARFRVEFHR